jgi:hypothetical protein
LNNPFELLLLLNLHLDLSEFFSHAFVVVPSLKNELTLESPIVQVQVLDLFDDFLCEFNHCFDLFGKSLASDGRESVIGSLVSFKDQMKDLFKLIDCIVES